MDGLPDISRLNTVRNLLAGLTTAAICGTGAALLMPRQAALNVEAPAESVPVAIEASESSDASEDVVYLGQLPDRLRSLSAAAATRAVFRPAGLSQDAQEPVVSSESSADSAGQPTEAQLFEPIDTKPAQDTAVGAAADDAVVQFEISEQKETATAEGVQVGREAAVHLQQAPATVNIPVNVTVNNGELLSQLELLKRQVEQLTRRLEASEAALAEARAAAAPASSAAVSAQVTRQPAAAQNTQVAKPSPAVRPSRPRIQRPPQPAGSVQIDYFPASGSADDRILQPAVPEAVPASPPPAIPETVEPQAAVSVEEVPDSAAPLITDSPVLPELVPDEAGVSSGTEEAVERAVPVIPAEPVPPQSGLPRASRLAAPVVAAATAVPGPAPVPGVPARTVSATRSTAPHSAPELQYENWRDPGVPQQAPAWGGTVSRVPAAPQSLVKKAMTNMREGVEETFDRLPTPDLRAPEWMRSMFRRTTKSAGRSVGGSGVAAPAEAHRGVIVRPASHQQAGPPRQGSGGAAALQPAQRAGVR